LSRQSGMRSLSEETQHDKIRKAVGWGGSLRREDLPTRLSTKFTLRSHCRTSGGGSRGHDADVPFDVAVGQAVRLGCFRSSGGTEHSVTLDGTTLKPFRKQ
jgi:hypothetical protein